MPDCQRLPSVLREREREREREGEGVGEAERERESQKDDTVAGACCQRTTENG